VFPRNSFAVLGRLVPPGPVANLLDLPMWLTIEFGARVLFLPLLSREVWRRAWRDDGLRWLALSAAVSLVAYTVAHSNLRYNAFGQRIILLPMVYTSLLAACVASPCLGGSAWWRSDRWIALGGKGARGLRIACVAVLAAGLPVGLWEAPMSAVRRYVEAPIRESRLTPAEQSTASAEQAAFRFMRYQLPAEAVVQGDPGTERATLAQIVRRQIGVIGPHDDVMVFDPPNREPYLACYEAVKDVLREGATPEKTYQVLQRHEITHIFIGGVELLHWAQVDRFNDRRRYEQVFGQDGVRVVKLRAEKSRG
jgi:hypothetical protein